MFARTSTPPWSAPAKSSACRPRRPPTPSTKRISYRINRAMDSLAHTLLTLPLLGYARGFFGRKNVGVLGAFFNVLLLAVTLVFLADHAFFFLIAWEIMALSAYCLVSFEHEHNETREAGVLYFVMSHIGTGCIMLG